MKVFANRMSAVGEWGDHEWLAVLNMMYDINIVVSVKYLKYF